MRKINSQKLLFIAFAILFLNLHTNAQTGWQEVFIEDDIFIRDICFVPGDDLLWNTGWAIAAEGDIYKTTDGGDTWTTYTQSHSTILGGISFADENTGFICTLDSDQILKSTDGGETWLVSYNGSGGFDKVAFKDDQNGVASGSFKVYTSDGGDTWQDGSGGNSYWDLDYAGGNTYYGAYLGGDLGRSIDNGETWSNIESLGQMAFMTKFLDESHGMFGGDLSKIMVTHNGGSTWSTTTLGDGQNAINTGGFFDADTLYAWNTSGELYKSISGGNDWDIDTTFSQGVLNPRGCVVTGDNVIFVAGWNSAGQGVIYRKIGFPPFGADFFASDTLICAGSSVDFTDNSIGQITSWEWEFEGGTPSTSSDQNPTVTYNNPGFYTVELTVSDGPHTETLVKTDYIWVYDTPAQADLPTGDENICTDEYFEYNISAIEYAQSYEWEIDPEDAGDITWNDTVATLATSESWTGDFTIRVRATNLCGNGDWSEDFEGTLFQNANVYNLEGGGGFCLDGEGVEITLSDSDSGIDYEIFFAGESTGVILEGTGSELSFGLFTEEGYYTCMASNENCTRSMENQVEVYYFYAPFEPEAPTGPTEVCNEESSEYQSEGSSDADAYVWEISPEEAGALIPDGLNVTVEWNNDFSGTVMLMISGENECGAGNASSIDISVNMGPAPVIDGESMVCDLASEDYSVAENTGSIFTWTVTGGAVTEGQGTNMVTISWGGPGSGSIQVEEVPETGCVGISESFEVVIDDCTDIAEVINETLHIYPNPVSQYVYVEFTNPFNETLEVFVVNSVGQRIISNTFSNESNLQFNLTNISQGLYFIQIQKDGIILATKKFLKK